MVEPRLEQAAEPWGGSHRRLIKLYRDAGGGECPVVMSREDAPSCGTTSSRFGCWTCTVVSKDKSLTGFVEAGFDQLIEALLKDALPNEVGEVAVEMTRAWKAMAHMPDRVDRIEITPQCERPCYNLESYSR